MSEIEELSQFLTLETRLDVKALALQQTLGIYPNIVVFISIDFLYYVCIIKD